MRRFKKIASLFILAVMMLSFTTGCKHKNIHDHIEIESIEMVEAGNLLVPISTNKVDAADVTIIFDGEEICETFYKISDEQREKNQFILESQDWQTDCTVYKDDNITEPYMTSYNTWWTRYYMLYLPADQFDVMEEKLCNRPVTETIYVKGE